jgi:hypothetical protein
MITRIIDNKIVLETENDIEKNTLKSLKDDNFFATTYTASVSRKSIIFTPIAMKGEGNDSRKK